MQGSQVFEYAVIRVVPHVEREEFLNAGIVLFCPGRKFLQARFELQEERLRIFCGKLDIEELQGHIASFERICQGGQGSGPIGQLTLPERFRWLTATRSTILQTSKVHPGFCDDPALLLDRLFEQLVKRD